MRSKVLAPRVDPGVWEHAKTRAAARLLGMPPERLVYHLTRLWATLKAQHTGDVLLVVPSDPTEQAQRFAALATALDHANPRRLLNALRAVGYLDIAPGDATIRVHDWARWQGIPAISASRTYVRDTPGLVTTGSTVSTTGSYSPVPGLPEGGRTVVPPESNHIESPEVRGIEGVGERGQSRYDHDDDDKPHGQSHGKPRVEPKTDLGAHRPLRRANGGNDDETSVGCGRPEPTPLFGKKPRQRKSTGEGPYSSAPFSRFMWWLVEGFGFRGYTPDDRDPQRLTTHGARIDMALVAECYLAIRLGKWGDRYDQRQLSARHAMSKIDAFLAFKERRHIHGTIVPLTADGILHHPSAERGGDLVAGDDAQAPAGRDGPADPFAAGYGPSDVGEHPKVRAYESRLPGGVPDHD
jgi:hypothetical protein